MVFFRYVFCATRTVINIQYFRPGWYFMFDVPLCTQYSLAINPPSGRCLEPTKSEIQYYDFSELLRYIFFFVIYPYRYNDFDDQ